MGKEKKETAPLTLAGNIDRDTFVRFALFDSFRLKKRWKNPAIFAAIFLFFALVCFLGRETHEQAMLMTLVLLAVGLVLPAVWLLMYMYSVNQQVKKNGLSAGHAQYFVVLNAPGVRVMNEEEKAEFSWKQIRAAYRVRGCIYLYVSDAKAFLMPKCEDSEQAWAILTEQLGEGKCRDLR